MVKRVTDDKQNNEVCCIIAVLVVLVSLFLFHLCWLVLHGQEVDRP